MASEALKQAMADLAASGDAPELGAPLPPSRLGTQDHWNEVYEREVKMFDEIGDEGEVWFGEDAAQDMVEWAEEHFPQHDGRILDIGTGNGQLLFALSAAGYTNLTGIDYSPASIQLAQSILSARLSSPSEGAVLSSPPPAFHTADILDVALSRPVLHVYSPAPESAAVGGEWDLVTDKGTYDAVCLSDEQRERRSLRELYVESVARLLKPGGRFLITSCNWTQSELENAFVTPSTGLTVHSHVPRASFQFGGGTGSSISTVAFEKKREQ